MNLGSGKYKNYMLGRFFKRFKKSVKSLCGKHMYLIDNIHPVFALCGLKLYLVNYLTNIINFTVRCGVHLDNIKNTSVINALADFTFAARIAVLRIKTVYSLGKNFCAGGFACSS